MRTFLTACLVMACAATPAAAATPIEVSSLDSFTTTERPAGCRPPEISYGDRGIDQVNVVCDSDAAFDAAYAVDGSRLNKTCTEIRAGVRCLITRKT